MARDDAYPMILLKRWKRQAHLVFVIGLASPVFGAALKPADEWITLLKSSSSVEVKLEAMKALQEMGPSSKDAIPVLISFFSYLDPVEGGALAMQAVLTLRDIGPAALPAVRHALQSSDPLKQSHALWTLGEMHRPETVNDIRPFLKSPDPNIQEMALGSLARMEPLTPAVLSDVSWFLSSSNNSARIYAMKCLTNIGAPAASKMKAVLPLLEDPVFEVQDQVFAYLVAMGPGSKKAVPALVSLLKKSDFYITREKIVETLGVIGPFIPQARAALEHTMKTDENAGVRAAAEEALKRQRISFSHTSADQ